MQLLKTLLLIIVTLWAVTACNAHAPSEGNIVGNTGSQPGLTGTNWRVSDLNGVGVVDNSKTSILFTSDGQVSGTAGCNLFSGTYSTRNGTLNFGPLAVTRRACVPALGDQENKFLDLMSKVEHYEIDASGNLLLKTSDGRTVTAQAS